MEKSERDGTAGVLLVIVAALVLNFTDLMEKNGTADQLFYDVSDAGSSSDEGIYRNEPDDGCNAWQSQWLYESSGAVLFCGRFAGNSVGGLAFYESAILLIAAVQWVQRYLLLPGVQLYVLFLLLDHLSKDDRLSHLAELVRTVIEWAMKSMTAAAIGFQVIQGLILPAVDGLKNTAVSPHRITAIPALATCLAA